VPEPQVHPLAGDRLRVDLDAGGEGSTSRLEHGERGVRSLGEVGGLQEVGGVVEVAAERRLRGPDPKRVRDGRCGEREKDRGYDDGADHFGQGVARACPTCEMLHGSLRCE
jgi:hypothetical protein